MNLDFFPGYIDMTLSGQKVSSPFVSGENAVLVGIRYAIELPYPPVQSLSDFYYLNANGQTTSMITGPFTISSVSNPSGGNVEIVTAQPHGLVSNATVTLAGNSALLALCNGQATQTVTVVDTVTLILTYITGTGTPISGTGTVTGYNFVQDLVSNPARLSPIFGQMWPVARVVMNAIQIDFVCGYAIPVTVSTGANSTTVTASGYTFLASDVGRPLIIPGAGANGGALNTILTAQSGSTATMRDAATGAVSNTTGLLVNAASGLPQHFEFARTAIKLLTLHWFEKRVPEEQSIPLAVKAILWPMRDLRF